MRRTCTPASAAGRHPRVKTPRIGAPPADAAAASAGRLQITGQLRDDLVHIHIADGTKPVE
jgi:hypothetical protein